jgi:xylulokinase
MSARLLGIDLGTTSTEAILIDSDGRTLARARREATLHSPFASWAEADPAEWWANVQALVRELVAASPGPVDAIGVTGMVPTLILVDDAHRPLRRSIQQNDARATDEIEAVRAMIAPDRFLAATGGSVNQQVLAPKLRWLARHEPEVLARARHLMGAYDWLALQLTGQPRVERNWALESGLYDLAARDFTAQLVALAGIDRGLLPPIADPHELTGGLTPAAARALGLAQGIPVVAGCADHVASAFVAGLTLPGDLLVKLGGAGDILLVTDGPRPDPRLFLDHHLRPGQWLSNGCMAASGSVLKWLAREVMGGTADYAALDHAAAAVPPAADGLVLLPYFLGEKTPLHDPHARGTLIGLGLHHGRAHLWRAALEAVAFGFRHHLDVIAEIGLPVRRVVASDGGAVSDVWLQITADVLGHTVTRIDDHPGSCLGAAFTAGIGIGAIGSWDAIGRYCRPGRSFAPDSAARAAYDRHYPLWREAYRRLVDYFPRLAACSTPTDPRGEAAASPGSRARP